MDPSVKDIDPVAFALERVHCHLTWIDEYRASFEAARNTDPETADRELVYLGSSIDQARSHMKRLMELVLAGHTIDRSMRLPKDLQKFA